MESLTGCERLRHQHDDNMLWFAFKTVIRVINHTMPLVLLSLSHAPWQTLR